MANIKFSQFTQKTTLGTVDFLVGYTGAQNIQIDPVDLLSDYSQGTGAAGQVTFFSAASTVTGDNGFYWDNTNKRLGIGTTSPSEKLHIEGGKMFIKHATTEQYNYQYGSGQPVWSFGGGNYFNIKQGGTTGFTVSSTLNVGIGLTSPSAKLHVDGTLIATGISQLGSGGNNVYLTSSSAGNVGIGTSSPGAKLQIGSATHAPNSNLTSNLLQIKSPSGFAYLTIGNGDVVDSTAYIGGASGFIVLGSVTDAGSKSEHMRITNIGTIGVGTNDPKARLHVSGSDSTSSAIRQSRIGTVIWDQAIDSSGRLQWGTRATEAGTRTVRFTLDDNGNAGVATGSPTYKLHVVSDITPMAKFEGANNAYVDFTDPSSSVRLQNSGHSFFGTQTNTDLRFKTNSTVKMSIQNSGNVGIGTTSPAHELDVAGVIRGTGSIRVDAGSPYFGLYNSGTEKAYLQWSQANSLLTLQSDGDIEIKPGANNVGIGTTSPVNKLDVNGIIAVNQTAGGNAGIKIITRNDAEAFLIMGDPDDNSMAGIAYNNSTNSLSIDSNNAERISINSSGNVGIGTTSPNALLHLESASSPALQITDTTQPTTLKLYAQDSNTHVANITAHDMVFDTNNTERMRITSGGNATFAGDVTIGSTSASKVLNLPNNGEIQLFNTNDDNKFTIRNIGSAQNTFAIETNDGTDALTISSTGDATFGGDVEIANSSDGIILESPDGTRYRVTVANGGTLSVSAV